MYHLRDIGLASYWSKLQNREIFILHLYLVPRMGSPRRNFVKMFDAGKTRMIGWWKNYDNTLSRVHTIPERNGQTDRYAISISRVSMLTRDKHENQKLISIWDRRTLRAKSNYCRLKHAMVVKLYHPYTQFPRMWCADRAKKFAVFLKGH